MVTDKKGNTASVTVAVKAAGQKIYLDNNTTINTYNLDGTQTTPTISGSAGVVVR